MQIDKHELPLNTERALLAFKILNLQILYAFAFSEEDRKTISERTNLLNEKIKLLSGQR